MKLIITIINLSYKFLKNIDHNKFKLYVYFWDEILLFETCIIKSEIDNNSNLCHWKNILHFKSKKLYNYDVNIA